MESPPTQGRSNRTAILGNRVNVQVTTPTEPATAPAVQETQLSNGRQDANIGRVDTPEQRTTSETASRLITQGTPGPAGAAAFGVTAVVSPPEEPASAAPQSRRAGFMFNQGNFFPAQDDTLPAAEVFALSELVETSDGQVGSRVSTLGGLRQDRRINNFSDFFSR